MFYERLDMLDKVMTSHSPIETNVPLVFQHGRWSSGDGRASGNIHIGWLQDSEYLTFSGYTSAPSYSRSLCVPEPCTFGHVYVDGAIEFAYSRHVDDHTNWEYWIDVLASTALASQAALLHCPETPHIPKDAGPENANLVLSTLMGRLDHAAADSWLNNLSQSDAEHGCRWTEGDKRSTYRFPWLAGGEVEIDIDRSQPETTFSCTVNMPGQEADQCIQFMGRVDVHHGLMVGPKTWLEWRPNNELLLRDYRVFALFAATMRLFCWHSTGVARSSSDDADRRLSLAEALQDVRAIALMPLGKGQPRA